MWGAIINMLLGAWVMLSPNFLSMNAAETNNCQIVGPLIVTIALTSFSGINRSIRYLNILSGLWLAASPFVFGSTGLAFWNHLLVGAAIIGFSYVKGKNKERYGGGWSALFSKHPPYFYRQ